MKDREFTFKVKTWLLVRVAESARIGAGAAPIRTDQGWLEIYYGATAEHRYCLGPFLMDLHDPSIVIARVQHQL